MTVMGYSQGCIRMLEMQGFQSFTLGRGNAGTIIQMDRTHKAMSDSFYCFTYGFSALIEALEAGINHLLGQDGAAGDNWVWLNQQVTNIKLAGGAGKLSGDFDTELSMTDISKEDGNIKKIKAKELILAIPRKSIESIEISKIPSHGHAKFRKLINSVVDINMTKINLYFDESWWNKDYGNCRMYGSSTTDLPIAQVSFTDLPIAQVSFTDLPIAQVSLTDLPITQVSFTDLPIAQVSFTDLPIAQVSFTDLPIAQVSFTDLPITQVSFTDLPITQVSFTDLPIAQVSFTDLPIAQVSFTDLPIAQVSFTDLPITQVSFTDLPITQVSFTDLPITQVSFTDLPIAQVSFTDLPIAQVSFTDLPIAQVSFTDLPIAQVSLRLNSAQRTCLIIIL